MNGVRWRTRYRWWRSTGERLGKIAKRPGTTVREVDGRVSITEVGFPSAGIVEAPLAVLDQIERAHAFRSWCERAPTVECETVYEYRDGT